MRCHCKSEHLNTWFPIGIPVWGGLRNVDSLEEVSGARIWGFKGHLPFLVHSLLPIYVSRCDFFFKLVLHLPAACYISSAIMEYNLFGAISQITLKNVSLVMVFDHSNKKTKMFCKHRIELTAFNSVSVLFLCKFTLKLMIIKIFIADSWKKWVPHF